ncbi:CopD family protein [Salinisphaera sp.]|uniref:CopD family protein n=1 Tax=Salinisphaera sp. TaxID=1914330 RepID=UPI002D77604C|nr:CopD family protein [Salinisphaera sp.]HET7315445.1 CopD family protein [Salinisphaera sp.]
MLFLWLKALHVSFMVAWFAGLFYLPRLFVYHAEATDEIGRERFSIMERRLSKLMSIAALGTIAFGIWMLTMLGGGWLAVNGWFHAKLALVVLLIGFHGWCQVQVKKFREDRATGTPKFYRLMNEVPAVILLLIMILVFVQPF